MLARLLAIGRRRVTGPTNPFPFRPCRACASKLAAPGEVVVADLGATIALGLLVGPKRERLSAARRRQAQALYARFANVPRAPGLPPADEPIELVSGELCRRCASQLAEFSTMKGQAVMFSNAVCAPLAYYVDPSRASLSDEEEAQAFRLQLGIIFAVDRMFEPFRVAFHEQADDEAGAP
jgi:hypothetical protein